MLTCNTFLFHTLTSWTCPICQNLHAGDPRQLNLKVAFTIEEQISDVQVRDRQLTKNWCK